MDDQNFYQFIYVGELDVAGTLRIIKREEYNGQHYLIFDIRNHCQRYALPGYPHRRGALLVAFNETETTDRRRFMEIWQIEPTGLKRIRRIAMPVDFSQDEIRFAADGREVLCRQLPATYWAIRF